MNHKHLACVILFGIILGCFQLTMVMHKRLAAAREAQYSAETALKSTKGVKVLKMIGLQTLQQNTAAIRKYLERWLPKLEETNEETKARALMSRVLGNKKDDGLVTFSSRSSVDPNKESTFIPQKFRTTLAVEGDYTQVVALIGNIERQLPASRLAMINLSKGQRASDLKLSLSVEIPMIAIKDKDKADAAKK